MRKYMLALSAFLTPVLLSAPAYAAEPGDIVQPDPGNYIPVVGAIDDLVDVMGDVWNVMTSNPFFLVLLASSLLSVGIWLFRRAKRTARG